MWYWSIKKKKKKILAKDDSILQEGIPVFNWVVYCYQSLVSGKWYATM